MNAKPQSEGLGRRLAQLIKYITLDSEHELGEQTFDEWWRKLCSWPPNVFALTAALLHESGLYREHNGHSLSDGERRAAVHEWLDMLAHAQLDAGACCSTIRGELPKALAQSGRLIKAILDEQELARGAERELREALGLLHALSDEACAAMTLPDCYLSASKDPERRWMPSNVRAAALERLMAKGTTSCLDTSKIRILPKKHTPQVGITLRSMSLFAAAVRGGEVDVTWKNLLEETPAAEPGRTNLLLVPWPFEMQASWFRVHARTAGVHGPDSADFTYTPQLRTAVLLQHIRAFLQGLDESKTRLDGLILPEAALDESEFERVFALMKDFEQSKSAFLLSGVRVNGDNAQPGNEAWFRAKVGDVIRQPKHHRWWIDESQIRQYDLGSALLPKSGWRYGEQMKLERRSVHFVQCQPQLTLCHLICEDLARVEPVAEVIRAVGPNLVIGLLLDGPQMERRWPGRYASIFADDPGSSVLTLSALGMVQRSLASEGKHSRTVALWKDKLTGTRELSLPDGHRGLLLSLCTNDASEWSYDNRHDGNVTGILTFGSIEPLRGWDPSVDLKAQSR